MPTSTPTLVDHTKIKFSQALTATLLVCAFVIDRWELAALVAALNLIGALLPPLSLFGLIYAGLLRPLGLLRPHNLPDRPEPHRFAQGFSGAVTGLGAGLVVAGFGAGWAAIWLVVILAGLNIFVGFCAGCFTYYQLGRLGLPGFRRSWEEPA